MDGKTIIIGLKILVLNIVEGNFQIKTHWDDIFNGYRQICISEKWEKKIWVWLWMKVVTHFHLIDHLIANLTGFKQNQKKIGLSIWKVQ